ncbi:MAG TPA: hypothetical protein VN512_05745 [Clostridia bacterium]|nr:hypothetical protein [Clostridia bacterium]
MKKTVSLVLLFLAVSLAFSACSVEDSAVPKASPTPTPGGISVDTPQDEDAPVPTPTVNPIPPDSIWTLTGTVNYRQTLEEGYYADYSVELDFVKLDGAYPSGQYTGDVYVSLKLDAADYIKEILSALPEGMANINFDVEGYGLRNALSLNVLGFTEFQKEGTPWPSSHTKNAGGAEVAPAAEEYVANTAFLMGVQAKGTAGASGSSGAGTFKIGDYDFSGSGDEDVKMRVIIEPDSVWGNDFYAGTSGTRKVQLFLDIHGVEFSGEGTLERQPNSDSNQQNRLNRERLGEKHGVDETP